MRSTKRLKPTTAPAALHTRPRAGHTQRRRCLHHRSAEEGIDPARMASGYRGADAVQQGRRPDACAYGRIAGAQYGTEAPRPARLFDRSQPCGSGVVAGTLRGAPPSETAPTGLGCRAILFRIIPDSRLRARPFGMEEVISGAIAFCSESTFAMSVEI